MHEAFDSYRQLEIGSSSGEVLVLRLFEAGLRHGRAAVEHSRAGRVGERSAAVSKVLAIVGELQQVLDFEQGGEIAHQLDRLYAFVSTRLIEASVEGRPEKIEEALRILEPLCAAWAELVDRRREDAP